MEKIFKFRLFFRIISVAATLIILSAGAELFNEDIKFPFLEFLNGVFPMYFLLIIIIYSALDFNLSKYILKTDSLIIKRFLRKQKSYALEEIVQLKEDRFFLFPGLKMRLQSKKRPIRLDIDRSNEFIEDILNTKAKNDEVIIDEKRKIINFLPYKPSGADGVQCGGSS